MQNEIHLIKDLDIIKQLRELDCTKLVLGRYSAIVGQFGFTLNFISKNGTKSEYRYKEGEEIHITEILDDNYFLSGDLTPSFKAHKSFFKGIIKYY
jgi:hypothetical protein